MHTQAVNSIMKRLLFFSFEIKMDVKYLTHGYFKEQGLCLPPAANLLHTFA
jgi:hypothetical protein